MFPLKKPKRDLHPVASQEKNHKKAWVGNEHHNSERNPQKQLGENSVGKKGDVQKKGAKA